MALSRPHAAVVALTGLLLAAPAATQAAERIGLTPAAGQPDGAVLPTRPASLGPDARFVAFASRAGNLVAGDTNFAPDVFLLDRASGAIERQSVTVAGLQSPQGGLEGVASPDGTRVVLRSTGKLVPSDVTGFADLYLRDRSQGTLVRLSGGVFGELLDADVVGWDATTDLGEVVFTTRASNVVSGDANGAFDVFRRVVATGVTTRITAANSGPAPVDDPATAVDASSDGAFVAFDSSSASLVPMDTNGHADVFVWTRATGVVERVSVAWNGAAPDGASTRPSISDDGRYVAFVSGATNLVAGGDANGSTDVYVRDRVTATTLRASLDAQGLEVAAPASAPWMAPVGGWVAFRSTGVFLPGDVAGSWKLLARDLVAGGLAPILASIDGAPFVQPADLLAATPDAGVLLVASAAANLVAGDSNAAVDLFLVERPPRALRTICAGDGTAAACPCANGGGIGRGCANSLGSPGALLAALGEPDPLLDTLTLHATRLPPGTIALFLQGTIAQSGGQGLAFGDGLRCAAGTIVRLAQRVASGGAASLGFAAGDPPLSVTGLVPPGGGTRVAQVWYRNSAAFCTSATFNLTNGVEVTWAP